MQSKTVLLSLSLAVLGGFLAGLVTAGDSDRLNPAAKATLAKLYDHHDIVDVDDREKNDEPIYVIQLKERGNRREILLEIAKDGALLEIDEHIPLESIPKHIQRAVRNVFPKSRITHGEMETEMSMTYRLDLENDGKQLRVTLSRSGKIHEIERQR